MYMYKHTQRVQMPYSQEVKASDHVLCGFEDLIIKMSQVSGPSGFRVPNLSRNQANVSELPLLERSLEF